MVTARDQITHSQPGSDIYGLVEKMAFHYHLMDDSDPANNNWINAENTLIRWWLQKRTTFVWRANPERSIHGVLDTYAHEEMREREFWDDGISFDSCSKEDHQFNDWMYAQDKLAQQVLEEVVW